LSDVEQLKAEVRRLKREAEMLRQERDILKKNCVDILAGCKVKRFEAVEQKADELPVSRLCEVLQVSRSGYYAWCGREPSQR
jgi:hypothetical protein